MTTKQKSHSVSRINLLPLKISDSGSTNVTSIVSTAKCSITNTVVCREFQENGANIDLTPYMVLDNWSRPITRIVVPPVRVTYEMGQSVAILHPIARRANTILRVKQAVSENKQDIAALQKAVNHYYTELAGNLFGKNGVFNRYICGPRMKRSFRAVIVPGRYTKDPMGESYEWVGIPQRIFNKLNMHEGQVIIVGRDPTIWAGSLEVVRAYKVEHDSMVVHPLLLPQLGGDHDGDQCWGMVPKEQIEDHHVCSFLRTQTKWAKNLTDGHESNAPAFDHGISFNFLKDEANRVRTTGLSVSPKDIVNNSDSLQRILHYCGKGSRARGKAEYSELQDAYKQLPLQQWLELTNMINRAQLGMKIYMGPVGLVALRLIVMGHSLDNIKMSANILAERCAQSLLDAKHLTAKQIKDYKPAQVFEILNLQREDIKTPTDMFNLLVPLIGCDMSVMPVLEHLFNDGRGLSKLCQEDYPLFEGTTFTGESAENGYTPDIIFTGKDNFDEGVISHAFFLALAKANETKKETGAVRKEQKNSC